MRCACPAVQKQYPFIYGHLADLGQTFNSSVTLSHLQASAAPGRVPSALACPSTCSAWSIDFRAPHWYAGACIMHGCQQPPIYWPESGLAPCLHVCHSLPAVYVRPAACCPQISCRLLIRFMHWCCRPLCPAPMLMPSAILVCCTLIFCYRTASHTPSSCTAISPMLTITRQVFAYYMSYVSHSRGSACYNAAVSISCCAEQLIDVALAGR